MSKFNVKSFFERLRFKYKLSILNENTLEEVWYVRLSRLRVYLLAFLCLVVFFFINTMLITKTPLRKFAPGYLDSEVHTDLINKSIKLDSLMTEFQKREEYIDAIKSLMLGNIKIDKVLPIDSVALKHRQQTFTTKSAKEKEFCDNFESEEKYNLSVIETKKDQKAFVFCAPTTGVITKKYQLTRNHYGIEITASPNASVVSVLDGNVIFAGYTIDEGYVIEVQHADNFISMYKYNSQLLKSVGDQVKSGETIAVVGSMPMDTKVHHLYFELWHNGKPQNPEEFILFK